MDFRNLISSTAIYNTYLKVNIVFQPIGSLALSRHWKVEGKGQKNAKFKAIFTVNILWQTKQTNKKHI